MHYTSKIKIRFWRMWQFILLSEVTVKAIKKSTIIVSQSFCWTLKFCVTQDINTEGSWGQFDAEVSRRCSSPDVPPNCYITAPTSISTIKNAPTLHHTSVSETIWHMRILKIQEEVKRTGCYFEQLSKLCKHIKLLQDFTEQSYRHHPLSLLMYWVTALHPHPLQFDPLIYCE